MCVTFTSCDPTQACAMIWRNTGPGHDIAIAYVVPDMTKAGRVVDSNLLRTLLMDKVLLTNKLQS